MKSLALAASAASAVAVLGSAGAAAAVSAKPAQFGSPPKLQADQLIAAARTKIEMDAG